MSEKRAETEGLTKAELLQMLAQMTAEAAMMHKKISELSEESARHRDAMNYWVAEFNKATSSLKDAKSRIAELEGPLAALARAAGEGA